jgi:hypothetical protein
MGRADDGRLTMSQEPFPIIRVFDKGLNAHRTYQTAKCSECNAFENLPMTGKNGLPPEVIVKKMQQRGWVMGHRRRHDLCHDCAAKKASRPKVERLAHYQKQIVESDTMKLAEPPRQPTREEKRLIVLAIEDHYDDKARGYTDGWSDEKVATDLNVPRKWVSDLREEFYGPAIDPELAALDRQVKELQAAFASAADHLNDLRAKLNDVRERIAKKMAA